MALRTRNHSGVMATEPRTRVRLAGAGAWPRLAGTGRPAGGGAGKRESPAGQSALPTQPRLSVIGTKSHGSICLILITLVTLKAEFPAERAVIN